MEDFESLLESIKSFNINYSIDLKIQEDIVIESIQKLQSHYTKKDKDYFLISYELLNIINGYIAQLNLLHTNITSKNINFQQKDFLSKLQVYLNIKENNVLISVLFNSTKIITILNKYQSIIEYLKVVSFKKNQLDEKYQYIVFTIENIINLFYKEVTIDLDFVIRNLKKIYKLENDNKDIYSFNINEIYKFIENKHDLMFSNSDKTEYNDIIKSLKFFHQIIFKKVNNKLFQVIKENTDIPINIYNIVNILLYDSDSNQYKGREVICQDPKFNWEQFIPTLITSNINSFIFSIDMQMVGDISFFSKSNFSYGIVDQSERYPLFSGPNFVCFFKRNILSKYSKEGDLDFNFRAYISIYGTVLESLAKLPMLAAILLQIIKKYKNYDPKLNLSDNIYIIFHSKDLSEGSFVDNHLSYSELIKNNYLELIDEITEAIYEKFLALPLKEGQLIIYDKVEKIKLLIEIIKWYQKKDVNLPLSIKQYSDNFKSYKLQQHNVAVISYTQYIEYLKFKYFNHLEGYIKNNYDISDSSALINDILIIILMHKINNKFIVYSIFDLDTEFTDICQNIINDDDNNISIYINKVKQDINDHNVILIDLFLRYEKKESSFLDYNDKEKKEYIEKCLNLFNQNLASYNKIINPEFRIQDNINFYTNNQSKIISNIYKNLCKLYVNDNNLFDIIEQKEQKLNQEHSTKKLYEACFNYFAINKNVFIENFIQIILLKYIIENNFSYSEQKIREYFEQVLDKISEYQCNFLYAIKKSVAIIDFNRLFLLNLYYKFKQYKLDNVMYYLSFENEDFIKNHIKLFNKIISVDNKDTKNINYKIINKVNNQKIPIIFLTENNYIPLYFYFEHINNNIYSINNIKEFVKEKNEEKNEEMYRCINKNILVINENLFFKLLKSTSIRNFIEKYSYYIIITKDNNKPETIIDKIIEFFKRIYQCFFKKEEDPIKFNNNNIIIINEFKHYANNIKQNISSFQNKLKNYNIALDKKQIHIINYQHNNNYFNKEYHLNKVINDINDKEYNKNYNYSYINYNFDKNIINFLQKNKEYSNINKLYCDMIYKRVHVYKVYNNFKKNKNYYKLLLDDINDLNVFQINRYSKYLLKVKYLYNFSRLEQLYQSVIDKILEYYDTKILSDKTIHINKINIHHIKFKEFCSMLFMEYINNSDLRKIYKNDNILINYDKLCFLAKDININLEDFLKSDFIIEQHNKLLEIIYKYKELRINYSNFSIAIKTCKFFECDNRSNNIKKNTEDVEQLQKNQDQKETIDNKKLEIYKDIVNVKIRNKNSTSIQDNTYKKDLERIFEKITCYTNDDLVKSS